MIENKHLTCLNNNLHKNNKLEPSFTQIHVEKSNIPNIPIPSSNVVVNQNNSCYNNINIYSNNHVKSGGMDLKNYITNKINKNRLIKQSRPTSATLNY